MYIIAVIALMYIMIVRYTADMTAPKVEHQERIADVRNALADAIERARYYDETTVLTSRGKHVAVLVGMDFYTRALAALGEDRLYVPKGDAGHDAELRHADGSITTVEAKATLQPKKRSVRVPKRAD